MMNETDLHQTRNNKLVDQDDEQDGNNSVDEDTKSGGAASGIDDLNQATKQGVGLFIGPVQVDQENNQYAEQFRNISLQVVESSLFIQTSIFQE